MTDQHEQQQPDATATQPALRYPVINPLSPNALPSCSSGQVLVTHLSPGEQMEQWRALQERKRELGDAGTVYAQPPPQTAVPASPPSYAAATTPAGPDARSSCAGEPVLARQVPPHELFDKWAAMYDAQRARAQAQRQAQVDTAQGEQVQVQDGTADDDAAGSDSSATAAAADGASSYPVTSGGYVHVTWSSSEEQVELWRAGLAQERGGQTGKQGAGRE